MIFSVRSFINLHYSGYNFIYYKDWPNQGFHLFQNIHSHFDFELNKFFQDKEATRLAPAMNTSNQNIIYLHTAEQHALQYLTLKERSKCELYTVAYARKSSHIFFLTPKWLSLAIEKESGSLDFLEPQDKVEEWSEISFESDDRFLHVFPFNQKHSRIDLENYSSNKIFYLGNELERRKQDFFRKGFSLILESARKT